MKEINMIIMAVLFSPLLMMGQDKVGIGVTNPKEKLEVAGKVFSNQGGFKFPDSTVQATAAYNTSTSDAALPKLLGYIKIENVQGPITRDLHFKNGNGGHYENLIPVYEHEIEIEYVGGLSPYNFGPLQIASDISIAAPDLLEAFANASSFRDVNLYLLEDMGGTEIVYSEIALRTSALLNYNQKQIFTGDSQYAHLNRFSFNYDRITLTVYYSGGSKSYTWDISAGPA
ncbi:MAG: hypothetical protein HKN68_11700 [Saprospiraceae bacterium]|nr:hypothetical protein [Saprospiraceae bacterium]